ncbi:hypothetical protein PINS_up016225 [Pythium insidiosum]|nr:hypothetical protein PINS_up016225 [Pythium insidiosum]
MHIIQWLRVLVIAVAFAPFAFSSENDTDNATNNTSEAEVAAPPPEPMWGRIYLRDGLAPIQYFRDRYGGPMVDHEVEFFVPHHPDQRWGCEPLPERDQAALRASNGTMVLVVDRGTCSFETKSRIAYAMGAAALVVVSSDESSIAPNAVLDADDDAIPIASVMIRKTGGDLLRHIASRQRVFGRLIPMVCERKPYVCRGRREVENDYMSTQLVRSGVLTAAPSNAEPLGDFLAASYGGVLPVEPQSLVDVSTRLGLSGCEPIEGRSGRSCAQEPYWNRQQGLHVFSPHASIALAACWGSGCDRGLRRARWRVAQASVGQ